MQKSSRPNILFIYCDQHRPDWLGCATGRRDDIPVRTPNLDRLAAGGVRFTNAVCPSPLCSPSRVSLAVGKEYHNNGGVLDNLQCHVFSNETFYTRLRNAGYYTFQAGKLDLSKGLDIPFSLPSVALKHGRLSMDELGFCDMVGVIGKWAERYDHYAFPMDPYEEHLERFGLFNTHLSDMDSRKHPRCPRFFTEPTKLTDEHYKDNWVTKRAVDMFNSVPPGRPWFLQLNFDNPHDPSDITDSMARGCRDRYVPGPHRPGTKFAASDHLAMRQNYTAQVENNDRLIGLVLDELIRRGEMDNTLIVYTSDHGEMMGDHGLFGKCRWRWESTGVPLIVSGPGVTTDTVNSDPVTNLDLAATFLDYASAGVPDDYDSISLRGVLEGSSGPMRDYVVSGMLNGPAGSWRMVFDGRYKLVRSDRTDGDMLFDLSDDPYENVDVAGENSDVVARLSAFVPEYEPMEPEPYVIVRLDPRCPGAYNVHAGAAASVASPVYSLDLYHNSLRISQARTNLAIAKIPRLEPGTHTFKAVLPGGQTAEIRIVVN
ncbi:MAG: sulfatase-like hydrolase/transferase [Phycisphaerae bacterium]|nr:sulfatase-like hydrolase/transferase [Phycisphaerae bacterium]